MTTSAPQPGTRDNNINNNYQSFLSIMMQESDPEDRTASKSHQSNEAAAAAAAIREKDIQALLEAGVDMVKLEELYGSKAVHRAAEAYITSQSSETVDDNHDDRRSKLATLLFLRAPSSSLQSIMKSNEVIDYVFQALVADPEDPLLMDPLLHIPMHDPVALSSGIIVDRSTVFDPVTGKLRLQKCPFRRIPIALPVYELYPLREKVRAWEHDRLERCVSVAHTMVMRHQDYERAEQVFVIANGFLQEHTDRMSSSTACVKNNSSGSSNTNNNNATGSTNSNAASTEPYYNITSISPQRHQSREILLLAIQLAQLERELPGVKDDINKTVAIHQRLIQVAQACSSDKADVQTLVVACLEDCWKRCNMLLAFDEGSSHKALAIRHAFAPLMKYSTLLQLNLVDDLKKVCRLDLTLAKHVEHEGSIWNCRRVLLKLLADDESERADFLKEEGITGDEDELYFHLPYDYAHWPHDKFIDKSIGLVHFGANSSSNDNSNNNNNKSNNNTEKDENQSGTIDADTDAIIPTLTQGLPCSVDLNPRKRGDHWIEVAFRPDKIQSPGHLNSIFSQHGPNAGWEIRCAVKPRSGFFVLSDSSDSGGIHVEALWTTGNPVRGGHQHNEFANTRVPIEIGSWYHVVLVYCHERQTLSLYVNGQPVRNKVSGDFLPEHRLPVMGQNVHWKDRRFHGWVAFASGGYEIPWVAFASGGYEIPMDGQNVEVGGKDEAALDRHVMRLAQARLSRLPKQPLNTLRRQESSVLEDVDLDLSNNAKSISDSDSSDEDNDDDDNDSIEGGDVSGDSATSEEGTGVQESGPPSS